MTPMERMHDMIRQMEEALDGVTVLVPVTVKQDTINEAIEAGLQGGISYWGSWDKQGGRVAIYDHESAVQEILRITPEKIRTGLVAMATQHPRHFADLNGDRIDAITGDVLIQCAIFGEVVHA